MTTLPFKTAIAILTMTATLTVQAGSVLKFQNLTIDPLRAQPMVADQKLSSEAKDQVVQFHGAITEADKAQARALGIRIFRYVPDDALIVRATHAQIAQWAAKGKIRAAMPFQGRIKLDANLPAFSIFSTGRAQSLMISAFTVQDAQDILKDLYARDAGLVVLDENGRTLAVQMDPVFVSYLLQRTGVEFVQALPQMQPLNMQLLEDGQEEMQAGPGDYSDLTGYESGTKIMGFESVWSQGFSGQGQIVGVADTGLDIGATKGIHVDFTDAVVNGYSYGIGAKLWDDPMGHGTHVAGSVLSRGTASKGALKGGAFSAHIVPQGMWSPLIDNLTVPPKLATMFESAYKDGARIHTNSWGAARNFGAYDAMAQQVDEFMWTHPDFLVLFAAGNSGVDINKDGRIDANSIGSPGTSKNTLTVGASENLLAVGGIQKFIKELKGASDNWGAEPIASTKISDNQNGMAMFSSRGPTTDGRLKPEIVAPGTNILSARSHVTSASPMWGAYNADYTYAGGTSMATPLTAGAAAIVRQVLMEKFKQTNPSGALIKATLMHTAFDMFPGQYGTDAKTQELQRRPNTDEGYGRVDMTAIAQLSAATSFVDSAVAQGEAFEATVQVKNGKLLANLVYTDAPGTPSAGAALVNDLDLQVTGPMGQVFAKSDSINNNEIVELTDLASGTYKVIVKGTKIPMGKDGKQPFALVYTAL